MQKVLIYSTGYHSRLIFRSQKKNYLIKGFFDKKIIYHGKKIFDKYEIFNPKNHKKIEFDKILFAGFSNIQIDKIIKFYNFPKDKILRLKKIDIIPLKKDIIKREKKTLRMIKDFVRVMNKYNYGHMFSHSSLLAIMRKDPFAYYSDVDVLILKKDFNKVYLDLSKKLNNYSVKKYQNKNLKKITISEKIENYNLEREVGIIDIMCLLIEKKQYIYKSLNRKKINIPLNQFDKKIIYRYKKINLTIPFKIKSYMKLLYNNSWFRKPKDWSR